MFKEMNDTIIAISNAMNSASSNTSGGRKTKKRYTKKRYTKKTKKSKKQKGGYMYSQKKKRKSIKSTYHL
jgi:hypothetical protein